MSIPKINVAIADDQVLFRKGVIALINSLDGMSMVLEASNGKDLLLKLAETTHLPHVILLDLKMPEMDGIETTKILRQRYPNVKIIILSIYNEERFILHLLECGAHAYLFKDADTEEVEKAIRAVANDGFYFTGKILQALQSQQKKRKHITTLDDPLNTLTERELEVLKLICSEFSTEEIAEKLFISPRTVEGHRNNLLIKTGCRNVAGLVVFAFKNNLAEIRL